MKFCRTQPKNKCSPRGASSPSNTFLLQYKNGVFIASAEAFSHMELKVRLCDCGAGKCFHHGRGDCRPLCLRLDQFLLLRLALQLSRNRSRHVRLIRDHVPRPRRWWDWLQHQQWSGQSAPEEERNQAKAWKAFSKSKHRFQCHCQFPVRP